MPAPDHDVMNPIYFPKKIDRASYIIRVVVCLCASGLLSLLLSLFARVAPGVFGSSPVRLLMWMVTAVWYVYVLAFVSAPRLRDIGLTPWVAVAGIIPPVGLVLLVLGIFAPTGWWFQIQGRQSNAASSQFDAENELHSKPS